MAKNNLQAIRRTYLEKLVKQWHGQLPLSKRLGHADSSYISQLVTGKRPITEKTARKFEEQLGLPVGTFDAAPGGALPFAGTDHALVAASLRALGDAAERMNVKLNPQKLAELTAVVYEHSVNAGGAIDPAYVQRILKLVS